MGHVRNENIILFVKPEVKKTLGRPMSKWEDNIRMDLREWDGNICTGRIWLKIETSGGFL